MRHPPILFGLAATLALACLAGCSRRTNDAESLDAAGRRYVTLAFQLGRFDKDYVDSYYGPPEWRAEAERDTISLAAIAAAADSLAASLAGPPRGEDSLLVKRHRFLRAQLVSLAARARMLAGETFSFDEESWALYDAVAPRREDASFAGVMAELDSLLPGRGLLGDRYETLRKEFVIPPALVDTVFRTAISEARARTRRWIALPDSESFAIEYVSHQPWGGYNWYQGGYRSLIQVNVDLPIYIDRAIDLACHEGYPGHHVLNVLVERELVRGRGWTEFTLFALHAPIALIAEGSANVAPEVAFPKPERERFEKEVLFPLAGLDTALYDRYARVNAALDSLAPARIETARRYVDGEISKEEALDRMVRFELRSPAEAERGLRFVERYRSYVVNYGLGSAEVRRWLARNGGDEEHPERRWELFRELLSAPNLPSDLREEAVQ